MNNYEDSIHQQLINYGLNAKNFINKCKMLLLEIDRKNIWKKKGFDSIYDYALKIAGMSHNMVATSLWILKKTENMPLLNFIAKKRGLSLLKPIANIVTPETEEFWAKKAEIMSKGMLEQYVKSLKNSDNKSCPGTRLKTTPINIDLKPKIVEKLKKLKGQNDWNDLFEELLILREKHLKTVKPKKVKAKSRHIPKKIKTWVIKKTNGQCAFPGCTKKYKYLHHTKRFSLHFEHDPDHIHPLCKEHEKIAHIGLIKNEEKPPENWNLKSEENIYDLKHSIDREVVKFRNPKNFKLNKFHPNAFEYS